MNILVLDDDDYRHRSFRSHLLVNHFLTQVNTYAEFVSAMERDTYDVLFLDHDLNYEEYVSKDENGRELTGYDAALWIVKNLQSEARPSHIVIHSHNQGGAMQMYGVLKGGGYDPKIWEFSPSRHPLRGAGVEPNEN